MTAPFVTHETETPTPQELLFHQCWRPGATGEMLREEADDPTLATARLLERVHAARHAARGDDVHAPHPTRGDDADDFDAQALAIRKYRDEKKTLRTVAYELSVPFFRIHRMLKRAGIRRRRRGRARQPRGRRLCVRPGCRQRVRTGKRDYCSPACRAFAREFARDGEAALMSPRVIRAERAFAFRWSGMTWRTVGYCLGVTPQGARQAAMRYAARRRQSLPATRPTRRPRPRKPRPWRIASAVPTETLSFHVRVVAVKAA